MFGWFAPKCPVPPEAKSWIEQRLDWLSGQFGLDVFTRRAMILPTAEFFPDTYDGSEAAVRALLDRVCAYMDADPGRVDIEFFSNRDHVWLVNDRGKYFAPAAGLYDGRSDRTIIHLDVSQIAEPMDLVGTLAHEIAHLRLLGEGRVSAEVFDNELLTDLTVVFHGLGIFPANSPRAWESAFTTWPATEVRRPEYMTYPMYGYALAHAAWHRNERKPPWSRFLRTDARTCLNQGLRYLWNTEDTQFDRRDGGRSEDNREEV